MAGGWSLRVRMRGGCVAVGWRRRALVSRSMGLVGARGRRVVGMATLLVHGRAIIVIGSLATPMLLSRFASVGRLWLSRIRWLVSGVELWRAVARFSTGVRMVSHISIPLVCRRLSVSLESVSVVKGIVSLRISV